LVKNARYRTREYTVLAHGMHVTAVNLANENKSIAGIYAQNLGLKETV